MVTVSSAAGVILVGVQLRDQPSGSGAVCRMILSLLLSWFGIPEALDGYVAVAERSPTVVASLDGDDVGLLTLVHHSPHASEVYVMAVVPDHHRRGIGRKMLRHAENALARDGVEFLQVKTLSAEHPDEGYKQTRAFYLSYGFRPLEEFPSLWGPNNPALQLVKTVPSFEAVRPIIGSADAGRVPLYQHLLGFKLGSWADLDLTPRLAGSKIGQQQGSVGNRSDRDRRRP
jgi:ribosomal protein S18 acetylase RimI-like enzyme